MNIFRMLESDPQPTTPHIHRQRILMPFVLLALDPSLGGICLWGERTGGLDMAIQWLGQQLMQRGPTTRSAAERRPVRVPANASPAVVQWPPEPHGRSRFGATQSLLQRESLLQRARAGVLIIESADLLSQATAAALRSSLARMPSGERPVLIARSEQRPSHWPVVADLCAFWMEEQSALPTSGNGNTATEGTIAEDTIAEDTIAEDTIAAAHLTAVAETLSRIPLTADDVRAVVARHEQHHTESGWPPSDVHRLDLFVARTARALAALSGTTKIEHNHIDDAWQFVIAPRLSDSHTDPQPSLASGHPEMADDSARSDEPGSAEKGPSPATEPNESGARQTAPAPMMEKDAAKATEHGAEEHGAEEHNGEQLDARSQSDGAETHPDGTLNDGRVIVIPPADLFAALSLPGADLIANVRRRAKAGTTGTPASIINGRPPGHTLALGATVQAAIPWQRLRRVTPGSHAPDVEDLESPDPSAKALHIRPEDLRSHRRIPKRKVLYIIAVDGSGSMAQGRMQIAKAAALSVLAGAYKERRFVSLINFRGEQATIMSPPGRSSATIRRLITTMPTGGGTPLPAAIAAAHDVARRWLQTNADGAVHLIMFTDGKANVPLAWDRPLAERPPGRASAVSRRETARQDIAALAPQLRSLGVQVTFIDHTWRPPRELHDVASLLHGTIVRVARPGFR